MHLAGSLEFKRIISPLHSSKETSFGESFVEKAIENNRALSVARPMGLKLSVSHKYKNQAWSLVTVVLQLPVMTVLVCTPSAPNLSIPNMVQECPRYSLHRLEGWGGLRQWTNLKLGDRANLHN